MPKQLLCGRRIAALILEKNERTLQRWCDDGILKSAGSAARNRTMINVEDVLDLCGELRHADHELAELISEADQDSAEALNDLGIILLKEGRQLGAFSLFNASAALDYLDAMHWLYQCHQNGVGTEQNENLAMMWLNKAAALGHKMAIAQVNAMRSLTTKGLQNQSN
jgi:heme oxygenase